MKKVKNENNRKYLCEVVKSSQVLGLGNDAYSMAFKAFNWQVMSELDMKMSEVHKSFHAALFCFSF